MAPMHDPWLDVPEADYAGHMRSPALEVIDLVRDGVALGQARER